MDARVRAKLPLQVTGEIGVELEKKQLRAGRHPARNLAGVDPFSRTIFRNHAGLTEIHFVRDAIHERFRTGNDGRDLERAVQKSPEEQHAHEGGNSQPLPRPCPARMSRSGSKIIRNSSESSDRVAFSYFSLTSSG